MIVVHVEVWPDGDSTRPRRIGVIGVANTSELAEVSTYVCVAGDNRGYRRDVIVRDHRRLDGVWPLLARALSADASEQLTRDQRAIAAAIATRLGVPPDS